MRLPGRAWLQFEVDGEGSGSTIRQTAIFHPTGPLGTAYWYGLFPVHSWIFRGMLARIADAAQAPEGHPRIASRHHRPARPCLSRRAASNAASTSRCRSRTRSHSSPTPITSKRSRRRGSVFGSSRRDRFRCRRGRRSNTCSPPDRFPVHWRTEIVEWRPGRAFRGQTGGGPVPPLGTHTCCSRSGRTAR